MKKILLVSFSKDDWEGYEKILEELFAGEDISWEMDAITLAEHHPERTKDADLVLVTAGEMQKYVLMNCVKDVPIKEMNHTLEREQVDQIREICRRGRMSIASDTVFYSENRKAMLVSMGIPAHCLSAWAPRLGEDKLEENVLLFESGEIEHTKGKRILKVSTKGRGLLAKDTVIWMLMVLDRMNLLQKASVKAYLDRIEPILNQPVDMKEPRDYYTYVHDSSNRKGCILYNEHNIIYHCDNGAEVLLNKKAGEILGQSLFDCFGFLREYEDTLDQFGERVVSWSGRQIVMDLWRRKTHGVHSGYMVLSDYAAEAKKELRLRKQMIEKKHTAKYNFSMIQGKSPAISQAINIAKRVAKSDAGVLITGPSGVGKELFAQSIHNASERSNQPFISVNCGALVDSLLESELFGYEAGAFTGAKKEGRMGLFEQAHNGTLFLDEVGEMPLTLQVKLLRVLQEREVVRVGGTKVIPINVRIIAATNRNLKEMVHEGKFRLDLYYRLNVLPLEIPGLNDRREDIMDIFANLEQKYHYDFLLHPDAEARIIQHNYEGNVRELQNLVEYLGSLGQAEIRPEDLPGYMQDSGAYAMYENVQEPHLVDFTVFDEKTEIMTLISQMNQTGIGAGRRSLYARMQKQGHACSEGRIRKILLELEQDGFVEIRSGRGGVWALREYR